MSGGLLPWHEILIPPLNLSSLWGFFLHSAWQHFNWIPADRLVSLIYIFISLGNVCIQFGSVRFRRPNVARWISVGFPFRQSRIYLFILRPLLWFYYVCRLQVSGKKGKSRPDFDFHCSLDPGSNVIFIIYNLNRTRNTYLHIEGIFQSGQDHATCANI